MATKLGVFNESLRLLGERRLSSLSESRDHRLHLDDAYDKACLYCLEQGYWNFGMRSVEITSSASITPEFGFSYAFTRPSDWVRTYIVSPNSDLNLWISPFNDEAAYWYANQSTIWARFVSSSASYGLNLGNWPETFAYYVACRLAVMTCPSISSGSAEKMDMLAKAEKRALRDARAKDALGEPPRYPPQGTWTRSRSTMLSTAQLADPNRTIP